MRDITVTLYQFDELPDDKARERARQWYRDASAGDNYFSECTLSDAREWLTACGFSDIDFRWSGFWSQGDGASFVGTWRAADYSSVALDILREERPATCAGNTAWHAIAARLDKVAAGLPTLRATLKDNGCRYVHQHSVVIDIEESDDDEESDYSEESDDGEELQGKALDKALELRQEFSDACRYAMRQIYRDLESAYEWENADEQIDDALRANEYEFTIEGVRRG